MTDFPLLLGFFRPLNLFYVAFVPIFPVYHTLKAQNCQVLPYFLKKFSKNP
jgi:hypothetical protein